jgi:hypothetical protein
MWSQSIHADINDTLHVIRVKQYLLLPDLRVVLICYNSKDTVV